MTPDARRGIVVPTGVGVNRRTCTRNRWTRPVVPTGVGVNRSRRRCGGKLNHVVPTGVGVNRRFPPGSTFKARRPHRRGGEPRAKPLQTPTPAVVPTGVGVNRRVVTLIFRVWFVVPTGVGVNRGTPPNPRQTQSVVPTGVGVNRWRSCLRGRAMASSPQAWG